MEKRGPKKKGANITKEMFLEKLAENDGNCYQTYTNMGLPYNTYRDWRKTDEEFNNKVIELQNKTTDFVESKLMEGIKKGDAKLIQFYLRTKGNYTEKRVVELQGENTINVTEAIESIRQDLSE